MHKVRHLFLGASHFLKKNYNYFFPILQEYSILFLSLLHCQCTEIYIEHHNGEERLLT